MYERSITSILRTIAPAGTLPETGASDCTGAPPHPNMIQQSAMLAKKRIMRNAIYPDSIFEVTLLRVHHQNFHHAFVAAGSSISGDGCLQ